MKSVGLEVKFLDSVAPEGNDVDLYNRLEDSFHHEGARAETLVAENFVISEINQYDSDLGTVTTQAVRNWELAKPPSARLSNRRKVRGARRQAGRGTEPMGWWSRLWARWRAR